MESATTVFLVGSEPWNFVDKEQNWRDSCLHRKIYL